MPSSSRIPFDWARQRRHKVRNLVQTGLLLSGMLVIFGVCAWTFAGAEGVVWAVAGGGAALLLSPKISPRLVLAMYGARPVPRHQLPELDRILDTLADRAGLPATPRLWHVPSSMLNAFAVGHRDDAAIVVTNGILRALTLRELAGVLAHEISHIRNADLWVMNLADMISRITRVMAFAGLLVFAITLPAWLAHYGTVPWLLIATLSAAPTFVSLLQLALSRAREFDADLDAAGLTGDPLGLASALEKLEQGQGSIWERILSPMGRIPDPSLLRTHPKTEERIKRLLSLVPSRPHALFASGDTIILPSMFPAVLTRPRRRFTGLWY